MVRWPAFDEGVTGKSIIKNMRKRSKAFTLIEVLLVSSLVAILGLATFHSFGNGLKLWGRAERLNREAEVAIFLDKMAEDLRSTVMASNIAFKGSFTQISFPAIVLTSSDMKSSRAGEGLVDEIGAVQYHFDFDKHIISRRQADYGQALKGRWPKEEAVVATGIDDIRFNYEIASPKGFLLKSEVEGIPLGVIVEIHFSDDSGQHQLKRYLSIPVGG